MVVMKLKNISPFIRFARYLTLNNKADYKSNIPLDSRLFFTCGGIGEIEVEDKIYKMGKRSCIIIPLGTEYRLCTPEKTVTYIAVNFDFNFKEGAPVLPVGPVSREVFKEEMLIGRCDISDISDISDTELFKKPFYISDINIENELIKIEAEYSRGYEYNEVITKNLMHNILIECAVSEHLQYSRDVKIDVKKILDYINENYYKNLTNKEIAAVFGFNPNYISDTVKKYTGFSLHGYLLHIRILKSLTYLEAQNRTISEIADLCGFSEAGYFSRYFKKEMGISPTEYMNKGL